MKQKIKTNLLISSVAMMAALMTMIYLVATMPDRLELIIAFGLIVVADTYFLVDSIIRKVDEIANRSLDKQNELTKVEKGIYSVGCLHGCNHQIVRNNFGIIHFVTGIF